jgi:hypothetical protein
LVRLHGRPPCDSFNNSKHQHVHRRYEKLIPILGSSAIQASLDLALLDTSPSAEAARTSSRESLAFEVLPWTERTGHPSHHPNQPIPIPTQPETLALHSHLPAAHSLPLFSSPSPPSPSQVSCSPPCRRLPSPSPSPHASTTPPRRHCSLLFAAPLAPTGSSSAGAEVPLPPSGSAPKLHRVALPLAQAAASWSGGHVRPRGRVAVPGLDWWRGGEHGHFFPRPLPRRGVITGYDETTSYKTWYVLVAQFRSSFPQACAAAVRQRASIMHSESMATLPVVVLPSLVIHGMC